MLGNLADLAATGLASEPTLRNWIKAQPDQDWIIRRGSNGIDYEIDLTGAIEAWKGEEARKTEEARQRADNIRQLGLDLGLAEPAQATVGLSIAERKALLEEELVAIKLAEKRRELIPVDEVEAIIGDALAKFRQRGQSFAARLSKRVDLSRDQITAIERLIHSDQVEMADALENWGKELGNGGDDTTAQVENSALPDGG